MLAPPRDDQRGRSRAAKAEAAQAIERSVAEARGELVVMSRRNARASRVEQVGAPRIAGDSQFAIVFDIEHLYYTAGKLCPRCGEVKPLSEFSKNAGRRDGVHSICKACRRTYDHERYERLNGRLIQYVPLRSERGRRKWLRSLKEGKPCADCGGLFPPEVLQWDHRPETEKLFEISAAFGDTRDTVLAEIAKCDLVCTNCHIIRTFTRADWGQKWVREDSAVYLVAA